MVYFLKEYREAVLSTIFLIAALIFQYSLKVAPWMYLSCYIISYLAVGGAVWKKAFKSIRKGTIFSEFLLMGIATVGAFAIGKYAEGVAVMLFYMIGEYVQHGAVHRARRSIEALINQQPDEAAVERNGDIEYEHPSEVHKGEVIRVKPGEKVPLDGELITDRASFNTAALTGESKPINRRAGEEIWAGSINQNRPVRIEVNRDYENTKLSNILTMVREAAHRKAPTQKFISRFAEVYTPIVVWLAVALTFLPYLMVESYVFQDWFYRALIFLVVSCPCGLVISIPLGYFGGIGAASKNGILLKGSNFLDQLRKMETLFLDKTGTLTEGTFEVQKIITTNGFSRNELLTTAASLEQKSTHPIAEAILNNVNGQTLPEAQNQQEIVGMGLKALVDGNDVLVGNSKLLTKNNITLSDKQSNTPYTSVYVAVAGKHAGTIQIADRVKDDSKQAIQALRKKGLNRIIMLSGDQQEVVQHVANSLGIDEAYGGLLPEEKYQHVEEALEAGETVGFSGDGVNDAPVITRADVGIAMGGIGSDAAVETADVVIQTDQPSKIPLALNIANFTNRIVWQNIAFALGIKVLVLVLAGLGMATMWEAIFADVGVALIAIVNAIRVQRKFT